MRHYRAPLLALVSMIMCIVVAGAAYGQAQTAPGQRGSGFFLETGPSGARALGMGGTFIGFADDATAAEANPAGLVQLDAGEISANLSIASPDQSALIDFSGTTATFGDTVTRPTFLGYAQPFADGAFAVYYEQSIKADVVTEFQDAFIPINFIGDAFLVDEQFALMAKVQTFGGSLAYSLGDYVAVGASIRYSQLDWQQSRSLRLTDFAAQPDSVTLDFDLEEIDSSAPSVNFGVLVNPDGPVSAGFVYKSGTEYELERSVTPTCRGLEGPLCNPINFTVDTTLIKFPSVIGGGVTYRGDDFRVGADLVRITYSDLEDSFNFVFGFPNDEPLDDAVEFRVGGEYGFGDPDEARGFLRAGIFSSPDHDGLRNLDTDEVHFTFGGGGLFGNSVMLDGAVNVSDSITEFLVSLGIRF